MRYRKIFGTALVALLSLSFLLAACSSGSKNTTTTVEPQTIVLTQVVTQVFIPTGTPRPTQTPPGASEPVAAAYGQQNLYNAPIYYPLVGCSASRLHLGDEAMAIYSDDLIGLYRFKDLEFEPDLRQLSGGAYVVVMDGPFCNDKGWIYWQVAVPNGKGNDFELGFFPEGDGNQYWLMPVGYSEYADQLITPTPSSLFAGKLRLNFNAYRSIIRRGCAPEGK